jgi:hypothetical protein
MYAVIQVECANKFASTFKHTTNLCRVCRSEFIRINDFQSLENRVLTQVWLKAFLLEQPVQRILLAPGLSPESLTDNELIIKKM